MALISIRKKLALDVLQVVYYPALFLVSLVYRYKSKSTVIFGTQPTINNKYWSEALQDIEINSITVMDGYFESINEKEDYDYYFDDFVPRFLRINSILSKLLAPFFTWCFILRKAKYIILSFSGICFGYSSLWRLELWLLKLADIKTIIIPFGSDSYTYGNIRNQSLKNCLLVSYPKQACFSQWFLTKVNYWSRYADIVITGFMGVDGMPRWDVCTHHTFIIDTRIWEAKLFYSKADGLNDIVKILHTPNHRGAKGTEFIINAVEDLKKEGLRVDLILLEGIPNEQVQSIMQEVDILAEQLIIIMHGINAIEGMSTGLPVLSNLDDTSYTTVFRRYGYLDECPILSTTPETIKENLKLLITNPELREELGRAGRKYAEKYHSYKYAQYLFNNIFKKLEDESVDLINTFHPLKSEYVMKDKVKHPLINNKYQVK